MFDYDRYSRNDVVGEVSIRLEDFNVTTNLEVWAEVVKNKKVSIFYDIIPSWVLTVEPNQHQFLYDFPGLTRQYLEKLV